jgi:hypothetical protein
MTQEIESVKPILTVIDDEGDLVLSSTGPRGKAMVQAVLALANGVRKITIVQDGEMKVMKRNEKAVRPHIDLPPVISRLIAEATSTGPDIQDQFAADLEAGRTGEIATGEVPSRTPSPDEPVKIPARRKPQIFQDAAAPLAPELAEAEMDRLLQEAQQAEQDAVKVQEERRFQAQQAVQAGDESAPAEETVKAAPRKREPRQLAMTGRPCGKCGGSGQHGTQDPAGNVFMGKCPVCAGEGQVQVFARGPKFR